MTVEHRGARARRGTGEKFLAALAQVSDIEPEAGDRLPMAASDKTRQQTRPGYANDLFDCSVALDDQARQ